MNALNSHCLLCKLSLSLISMIFLFAAVGFMSYVAVKGYDGLSMDFVLSLPSQAGRSGGIFSILVSTLYLLVGSVLIAIPSGIMLSVLLLEGNHKQFLRKYLNTTLYVMAGMPTIAMGLFGLSLFGEILGLGYSLLTGILTLTIMLLPTLCFSFQNALQPLHERYSIQANALRLSKITTYLNIYLPSALPGLLAGITLAVCRVLAETAALLYTAGYSLKLPDDIFSSGRSLSVHIFDLSMNVAGGEQNAYASATVLIVALLSFSLITKLLASYNQRKRNAC